MRDIVRLSKDKKTKVELENLGLPLGNDRDDLFKYDDASGNFEKIRESMSHHATQNLFLR